MFVCRMAGAGIHVFQAVLLAGGFKDSAKSSQILVFRKLNADTAEVRSLNFKTLKQSLDRFRTGRLIDEAAAAAVAH